MNATAQRTAFARRGRNGFWFSLGFLVSYAAMNPDRSVITESMPLYRQRYFALISGFKCQFADHKDFETFGKDLLRYYQPHQGYLFSHLMRARDFDKATYQYYIIQTWSTLACFKNAFNTPYRENLSHLMRSSSPYEPQVMKIIADDSEYIPPPTSDKEKRQITRRGLQKIIPDT